MKNKSMQGFQIDEEDRDFLYYDVENIASATDCTGLIPTPPVNAEEAESYANIYSVPTPSVEKEKQDSNDDDMSHTSDQFMENKAD